METSDFSRFRAVMIGMGKVYEREVDAVLLDAYWLCLRDWSFADFERAAGHLMGVSTFMPRPAEFNKLRNAHEPTVAEAWSRVLEHCKGAYRGGSGLDDGGPIDQAAQTLGGYQRIAFYNTDYLGVLERRFGEHFTELTGVNETREQLPGLTAPSGTRPRIENQQGSP